MVTSCAEWTVCRPYVFTSSYVCVRCPHRYPSGGDHVDRTPVRARLRKMAGMRTRPTLTWEPVAGLPPASTDLTPVVEAVRAGGVLVLSGAGLSTESGVPDYRGENGSLRRHTPMTYQEFTSDEWARRRY